MNVIDILDSSCARNRDALAIAWGDPGYEEKLTFGELASRSRRHATLFREHGLQPGDAVAIFLPMSGELYAVMAAVLRMGMTAVFPDPAAWKETLGQAQRHLRLRGFVGTPLACGLRYVVPALHRIPVAFSTGMALPGTAALSESERCAPFDGVESCGADDTALLTFTSGSTGPAKGVLRSHGMLEATHRILSRHLALEPGQVHMAMLPFFVFAHLGAGATSVIPPIDVRRPAEADAGSLAQQIRAWHACGLVASPFLMARLADAADAPLESLRTVFTGGAPVWPRLLDRLADMAPNAEVATVYGATEAEPIAIARREAWGAAEREAMSAGRGVLAGRAIDEIELRVVTDRYGAEWGACSSEQFAAARCAPGRSGEIIVSGAHVSQRYLAGGANDKNKIRVEGVTWHRTGDGGYLDADGRLWLVGRCSAKVATDQGPVYPLRVEAALSLVPGIARATLVERHGKRLLALERVVGVPQLGDAEIAAKVKWCGIDEVVQLPHIPMDRRHHAKVDVPALRELLEAA